MESIAVQHRIQELTKDRGQITGNNLPELRVLAEKIYADAVIKDIIGPLIERVDALEGDVEKASDEITSLSKDKQDLSTGMQCLRNDLDDAKKAVKDFTELHRTAVERGDGWNRKAEARWTQILAMAITCRTLRGGLTRAKDTIRTWHGMGEPDVAWDLYQVSPEMTEINSAMGLKPAQTEKILDEVYEYLKGIGCDCGTDEPGTCGLCLMDASRKGE